MLDTIFNNSVHIRGTLATEVQFDHAVHNESFYKATVSVPRLSGTVDEIPLTIPQKAFKTAYSVGDSIEIHGQLRSYNRLNEAGKRLLITVFVRDITLLSSPSVESLNEVVLVGCVCKQPVYRSTPFDREIADVLLAVNRFHNKSDYIPCIAWGHNARMAGALSVGQKVRIHGRIQSRKYDKRLEDGSVVQRTAYELSGSDIISLQMKE